MKLVGEIRNTRRKLVWKEFKCAMPWGRLEGVISLGIKRTSVASHTLNYK